MYKREQDAKSRGFELKNEEVLLQRARCGDEKAKDAILRNYASIVGLCISAYHLAGGERDDLHQEGMIGLLKAIQDYRPDRNACFRTFAQLCIRRQVCTAVRGASRYKHGPLNRYVSLYSPLEEERVPLADLLPASSVQEPEAVLLYRETIHKLKDAVDSDLTDLERDVLFLHMEGKGYVSIGKILQKDSKAVDNALQRSKRKLARRIGGNYS